MLTSAAPARRDRGGNLGAPLRQPQQMDFPVVETAGVLRVGRVHLQGLDVLLAVDHSHQGPAGREVRRIHAQTPRVRIVDPGDDVQAQLGLEVVAAAVPRGHPAQLPGHDLERPRVGRLAREPVGTTTTNNKQHARVHHTHVRAHTRIQSLTHVKQVLLICARQ